MTPALVTGAPGWLGTRLVQSLAEGLAEVPALASGSDREIRVLVCGGADTAALLKIRGNVRLFPGDVTDPSSLAAFCNGAEGATLFHGAGIIHPERGIRQLYDVNEGGTRNLLHAATSHGVRRFIHVSSNSPIGLNPSADHVFDEDAPYRPYMHYGKSKKRGEDLVNQAHASGAIETVIIRPPWFYGTNQPERQSRFIRMVRDGKAPIVGPGSNRRSMAYIDNICQGLLLCERQAHARGRTYWIADERPYPMTEIIDTIERVLEEDFSVRVAHRRMRLPGLAAEVAVASDWLLQSAGLYVTPLHVLGEMNKTIACSIERARRELGYEPRIALREGMRRSIQWMLDQGMPIRT
jgi:nucleoside-diphosphate-sugar epimerase